MQTQIYHTAAVDSTLRSALNQHKQILCVHINELVVYECSFNEGDFYGGAKDAEKRN